MSQIKVLDHGYVELVEAWGSDERIVEAARMSTNKGFLGWGPNWKCRACGCLWRDNRDGSVSLMDEKQTSCTSCEHNTTEATCDLIAGDEKLLRYLWEHKHATPFEMAGLIIEVQAPIMVFREWHRHRTQSYNEMSARYTQLPDLFYVPAVERVKAQSKKNKQATGGDELPPDTVLTYLNNLTYVQQLAYKDYEAALAAGIPRELARLFLPVSIYSRMRASANLRNWLSFLTLRMAPDAQYEIRVFANAVGEVIAEKFPRTWELFNAPKGAV